MQLPIDVPVAPMLARLVHEVPDSAEIEGGYFYEPKWDGFRCVVLRDGDEVELSSRMNRSLTTFFPEVVEHLREALPRRCVIDSEIIVPVGPEGSQHLDWDALTERLHPSLRRIPRLVEQSPAELVAFDVLALDDRDLTGEPLRVRRRVLDELFTDVPDTLGLHLTAQTERADHARRWYDAFEGFGLDGLMVKERQGRYEYGRRSWLKVKQARTAEAVVIAYRSNPRYRGVGKLLLGMYDEDESLHYVGSVKTLSDQQRVQAAAELDTLATGSELLTSIFGMEPASPISQQRTVPVQPERVVEVEFDQLDGRQFRHAARFRRWRPDRDPHSCRLDQLGLGSAYDLASVLD